MHSWFYAHRFNKWGVGLGAYYKPVSSFDANYYEEVRNNRNTDNDVYPEKIAINEIESEGTLNKTGIVVSGAYGLSDLIDLNLGFEYGILAGDVKREKSIRWTDWAILRLEHIIYRN
jgi:hypothetical protein